MKEQKNDPAARGNQNVPGQKNQGTEKGARSQDQRNEQNEEQEGTKLPGRETRTPVAGEKKDSDRSKSDSGKGGDRKGL